MMVERLQLSTTGGGGGGDGGGGRRRGTKQQATRRQSQTGIKDRPRGAGIGITCCWPYTLCPSGYSYFCGGEAAFKKLPSFIPENLFLTKLL